MPKVIAMDDLVGTVLLVEDNPVDIKLVEVLLATRGPSGLKLEVERCLGAALERIERGAIHAILLDLNLPDSSGIATFDRVNEATESTPIVVLTGETDEECAAEAVRRGAQDFLVKGRIDGRSLATSLRYAIQRETALNALRSNEQRYRDLFESSFDPILVTASNGRLIDYNRAARELFGYDDDGFAEQSLAELCTDPEAWAAFEVALAGDETVREVEMLFTRLDGTRVECLVTGRIRRDDPADPRYQITIRDETERRKLQQDLVQAQKLESIGQLAAGIAHEINTPTQYVADNTRFLAEAFDKIRPILGSYQAAAGPDRSGGDGGGPPPDVSADELQFLLEQIPGAFEESLEGLDRVATIVRAMKEFSHPGAKDVQPLDLNKAIESTITVSRAEWKYAADLETDLDPDLPAALGRVNELNQVFLNMIVNASHAIEDAAKGKGRITISTRTVDDDWVEVRIADTGCGVPPEIRNRIFDPFFTTKDVGKGTGQGLSVARSVVVDKHHGTVDLESEVGEGTTFIIRLPTVPRVAETAAVVP